MEIKRIDDKGNITTVNVNDKIFNRDVNEILIYEAIVQENANLRQGTRKVKTRAEVRGGGAKPWRQKGTGRARQGSIRAPHWRGGGVVFGPKPRDFSQKMPKRKKRAAILHILSYQAKAGKIFVIDSPTGIEKTKPMFNFFKQYISELSEKKRVRKKRIPRIAFIYDEDDEKMKRAMRNLYWLYYLHYNRLNARDLIYADKILITEKALEGLNKKYAGE